MFEFNGESGSKIKAIRVTSAVHREQGWFNSVVLNMEVTIDSAKDMGAVTEAEVIDAIHREGRNRSEEDGAQTYELKTKRKFPVMDLTVQDGKLKVSMLAKITQYKTHVVEGQLYVTFAAAADVENDELAKLGRLMESPVKVTTLASQVSLFSDAEAKAS
jgi:hypothetical protein